MASNQTTPATTTEPEVSAITTLLNLASQLDAHAKELRVLSAETKKQVKLAQKALLEAEKKSKKKKPKDPNAPKRPPAGFAKPTLLSEELCTFLNVPADQMIARTDVTKMLTEYIKKHDLQNPENRREIRMDTALQKLLNPPDGVVVTFFTLQTYMKPHFLKADATTTPSSTPQPAKDETPQTNVVKKKVVKRKIDASSAGRRVAA